jgi:hypothetical protein
MPNLTECLIDVDVAIALREIARAMKLKIPNGNLQFRCPECNYPVKPQREGKGPDGIDAPHFEHIPGYPRTCKYRQTQDT